MKAKKRSKGAHALRIDLMSVGYHLERASDALLLETKNARDLGAVDQLAIAIKALRAIVNTRDSDARSKGVAQAALDKMEVTSAAS